MRTLSSDIQTLIDGGGYERHVAVVLVFPTDPVTYGRFSGVEILIDGDHFFAQLDSPGTLDMTLTTVANGFEFDVQNRTLTLGQQFTGNSDMTGVRCIRGTIFINLATSVAYFVPEIQGEITSSDIDQKDVTFKFIDDINVVTIQGRYISEVFPFKEQSTPGMPTTPIIVGLPGTVPLGGGDRTPSPGRYPILDPVDYPEPVV